MRELEQQLLDGVDAILGKDGIAVQQGIAGFRYNEQQHDYARRAASGYCRYDQEKGRAALNMLQASTGLGKTLAYLVPAMLFAAYTGKRIAVSTFTRHLQRQIVEKDALAAHRWVKELTGQDLNIARRVGRSNYVSLQGCTTLLEVMKAEGETHNSAAITTLEELVKWAEDPNSSGVLEDFLEDRALDAFPAGIPRHEISLDNQCPESDRLRFADDVKKSKAADVLIVNHALMVMHAFRFAEVLDDKEEGRPIALAIFDEADRLEDAAKGILSSGLALHKLKAIADKAASVFGLQGCTKALSQLHDLIMHMAIPANRMSVIDDKADLGKKLTSAATEMGLVARLLCEENGLLSAERGEQRSASNKRIAADFIDASNDLRRVRDCLADSDNNAIVSWSPVRAFPQLLVGSPNAGRIMSRLWSVRDMKDSSGELVPPRSYFESVLFTSATIATPGRRFPEAFDEFSKGLGIIRHPKVYETCAIHNVQLDLLQRYQPARFGTLAFVLADPRADKPTLIEGDGEERLAVTNPQWLDYCAQMIRAAQASGGRTLVLTLSWRDTLALQDRLAGMDNLLVHSRGEALRGLTKQYCDSARPNAVLLSPAAWEGVDLPGMVNNLVVTRIPFSPPEQIEDERMRIHLTLRGYDQKKIESILRGIGSGRTCRKLEQGLGRALRSPTDAATVWIADPRFPNPERFAESLDPVLFSAPGISRIGALRVCIPPRFLDKSFAAARLFLLDGSLHSID